MRGKVSVKLDTLATAGITPAYAGKSGAPVALYRRIEDHPRLCGEKFSQKHIFLVAVGSPPPMRGKGKDYQLGDKVSGITPAYAGKSPTNPRPVFSNRDHPRLCGEKTKKIPKQRYFFHQPASFSFSLQYT